MKQNLLTVGLIAIRNGKILFLKRAENDSFGGSWAYPGGGVEQGETFEEAIVREAKEEIGCTIKNLKYFKSYYIENEHRIIRSIYFFGEVEGKIKLNHEHTEFKWLSVEELEGYDIVFDQKNITREFIQVYPGLL